MKNSSTIRFKRTFASLFVSALCVVQLLSPLLSEKALAVEDKQPRKILSGWLTDYSTYGDTSIGQIQGIDFVAAHAELYQQVHPFWFNLKSESLIQDKYVTTNSIPMDVPIATLKSLGIKLLPTITDGTAKGALSTILSKDSTRATLINTIVDLINSKGFDGIDLDFEGFAFVDANTTWPTIQPRWVKFIQELSAVLHAQGKLLSVDTPVLFDPTTGKKGYYFYAWKEIGTYIDRLNIMAYDYRSKTSGAGPNAPITWFEPAINYAIASMPSWKIFIGTPNYGYNWVTRVVGVCPMDVSASESVDAGGAIVHQNRIAPILAKPGATVTFTPAYGETNIVYQSTFNGVTKAGANTSCTTTHSVWYVDAQGYTARANLVAKYQLGGMSEWEIGYGDATAADAVKAVALALGQYRVSLLFNTAKERVNFGEGTLFNGTFTLTDGRPVANVPIFAQITRPSGTSRKQIAVSGNNGEFSTSLILGSSAQISFSTDETSDRLAGTTTSKNIDVVPLISWNCPTSMKVGASYLITGQVQPRSAGSIIALSVDGQAVSGAQSTSDETGKFTIAYSSKLPGAHKLKLTATQGTTSIQGESQSFSVLVR